MRKKKEKKMMKYWEELRGIVNSRQVTNSGINNQFGFQLILITVNINIDTNANSVKT